MVNSKPTNKQKKKKISSRDVVITEDTYARYNSLYLSDFIPSKTNTILMSTLI